jgi:hypothetical protein
LIPSSPRRRLYEPEAAREGERYSVIKKFPPPRRGRVGVTNFMGKYHLFIIFQEYLFFDMSLFRIAQFRLK